MNEYAAARSVEKTPDIQQGFTTHQMSQVAADAWREIANMPQTVSSVARQMANDGFLNIPPLFSDGQVTSANGAHSGRGGNDIDQSRNGSVDGVNNTQPESASTGGQEGRFGGKPIHDGKPGDGVKPVKPPISDCLPPKPGVQPGKPSLPGGDTPDPCDGPEKIRCTPVKPDSVKPVKPEGGHKPEISDNAEIKKDVLKELSQLDGYESLTDQQLKQLFNDLYIDAMENRKK